MEESSDRGSQKSRQQGWVSPGQGVGKQENSTTWGRRQKGTCVTWEDAMMVRHPGSHCGSVAIGVLNAPRPGSWARLRGHVTRRWEGTRKSLPIQQHSQVLENMGSPNSEKKETGRPPAGTGGDLGGLATHATATALSLWPPLTSVALRLEFTIPRSHLGT